MKKGTVALTLIALALTGCANKVWNKYGASQQEFYQDRAECSSMSGSGNHQINTPQQTKSGGFNGGFQQGWNMGAAISASGNQSRIFNDCMMGRGWALQAEAKSGNYPDKTDATLSSKGYPPLIDPYQFNPDNIYERGDRESIPVDPEISQAVAMLMRDPFEDLSPKDRFWRDLGRQVPNYREINDDERFHYWLSVIDSTTGKPRQDLLIEAQKRHDAETVAAMFRQFLKTI